MPVITARRRGLCGRCKQGIVVGERIDFTRVHGALHLACSDGDDPEEEIVGDYHQLCSHLGGPGYDDREAFEACAAKYGYVPTVRALLVVSAFAKARDEAFQARKLARAKAA
jgi:hypothetical protein